MSANAGSSSMPTERPHEMGNGAFAALSEIVAILEADPATDWSRVDIGALRDHLVDMERLTLDVVVDERPVEGGLEIAITGPPAAVDAARRMVPAHAAMVGTAHGWDVQVEDRDDGLLVVWTTRDPEDVAHLRALGFFGLMATGGHHQMHHLMIATGRDPHRGHEQTTSARPDKGQDPAPSLGSLRR